MKNKFFEKLVLGWLIFLLIITSCTTAVRGTTEKFIIDSEPSEATVILSTGETGKTPAEFLLPRNKSFTCVISKAGYETYEFLVGPTQKQNEIAQLLSPIGNAVDSISSSKYGLSPNPCFIKLKKKSTN